MVRNIANSHSYLYQLLTSPDESQNAVLMQFVTMASKSLGIHGSYIAIMDDEFQHIKASKNLTWKKTARNDSFCAYVVQRGLPLVITDTQTTPQFCQHQLVTQPPFIRFYAGVPLVDREGVIYGTLCVVDTVPHAFTQMQVDHLIALAELLMVCVESWHVSRLTDQVTGTPNRQHLLNDMQTLAHSGDMTRRRLLMISCIDMYRVYDLARSMGMSPVEALLRDLASLLMQPQQLNDSAVYTVATGRFAILLQNDDPRTAETVASSLRGIRAQLCDGVSVELTPSVGETMFIPGQTSSQEVLRQAASALHEALRKGIHFMRFESHLDTQRTADFSLMNDLAVALNTGKGLYLVYQPKICLHTGQPVGFEALIRWRHPQRGELSPGMFIPLAEQTTLLPGLTMWVIETAIKWLQRLSSELRLPVTVNVSEKDFAREGFADDLEERMIKAGLPTSLLGVECLENERVIENPAALNGLGMLKLRGFSISLDDFGTGYSNISYLRRMPLDTVKIDRSLISQLATSTASQIIVQHIIIMLKKLDYSVVAEGVEDSETLDFLKRYGCDQVQGYFYCRPLPDKDIETWLKAQTRKK